MAKTEPDSFLDLFLECEREHTARVRELKKLSVAEVRAKIINGEQDAIFAVGAVLAGGWYPSEEFFVRELDIAFFHAINQADGAAQQVDLIRRFEANWFQYREVSEFYNAPRIAALRQAATRAEIERMRQALEEFLQQQQPAKTRQSVMKDLDRVIIAAKNQNLEGGRLWALVDDKEPKYIPQWRNPKFPWPGSFLKAYTTGSTAAQRFWKRRLNDYAHKATKRKSNA
jgi:hypothetical protein